MPKGWWYYHYKTKHNKAVRTLYVIHCTEQSNWCFSQLFQLDYDFVLISRYSIVMYLPILSAWFSSYRIDFRFKLRRLKRFDSYFDIWNAFNWTNIDWVNWRVNSSARHMLFVVRIYSVIRIWARTVPSPVSYSSRCEQMTCSALCCSDMETLASNCVIFALSKGATANNAPSVEH